MKIKNTFFQLALVSVLLLGACKNEILEPKIGPTIDPNGVLFKTNVLQIWGSKQQKCTGCHTGASAPAGLKLDSANVYASLTATAGKYINAADPATSEIITKITAGHNNKTYRLGQIDTIKAWVKKGALND